MTVKICNNVSHENCNNLPHGGMFTRNTRPSKTLAHKVVLIPSTYTTGALHFHIVSISSCSWIFLAQGEISKNLLGEVKLSFLAITFSYCHISSPNFACTQPRTPDDVS